MQRTKGALVSTAVKSLVPNGVLDIWWDLEIVLPNGWYDTERREYRYSKQPSCVGGKYTLPLSGTDTRKHRSLMTATNGKIHCQQNT